MFPNFSISQIRDFINKERVYILMLSFIFLFNAWIILAQKIPGMKESFAEKKVFGLRLTEREEEAKFSPLRPEKIPWSEVLEKRRYSLAFLNILGLGAAFLFCFGLFLDIRILIAKVKKREILKVAQRHLQVKWGISDIFKLAIIFIFLGYILHIIEANLLSSVSVKSALAFIPLLNAGIMDLLLLGFIIYFVKVKYSQGLTAIGLKIKGAYKFIFLAVICYIAFLPILAFLLLLLVMLASMFNYHPSQQVFFKLFLQEERIWVLCFGTIIVVMLGPVVEEVFFRGFAYNAIKRRWGVSHAIALTAIVFAGLHANLIGFLPIMALGILLAYVYEKTGSLIPSITIHILHNTLMVALLFLGRYFLNLAK